MDALLPTSKYKDDIDRSQNNIAFDQVLPDAEENEALSKEEEEEEEIDMKELLKAYMTGKVSPQTEPSRVPNHAEEEKIADNQEVDDDVRKEKALEAWGEDMKQQDESVRLQLAAMSLYVEDRTIDPNKKVSIIEDDDDELIEKASPSERTTEEYAIVLGLDNIREIVMACQMPYEARFAVFMLLKTLNRVIEMVNLNVSLLKQCEDHRVYTCRVMTDVLAATPLTNEFAQDMVELFGPLSVCFKRQVSREMVISYQERPLEMARLYSLTILVEKS